VVQISLGRGGQLQGPEADIVQGFIVAALHNVCVLDQLMHGKGGVVWLHHSVGHLRRGHDGEGLHDSVWLLLPNLGDEQGAHTGSSATSKRVGDLEALKAVASLSLLSAHIQN